MDLLQEEVKNIAVEAQLQQKPLAAAAALTLPSTLKENVMVGFEQVFLQVLDKLTGNQLSRQIIPITGMGGIVHRRWCQLKRS
ncbi:hypothetical protein AAHA92_19634 [Salvia divinorum]|uniref:Uncharacterized protein n=1 Tax=Salvia divinorum TaxID=28513 RepID=A0ABD1H5Z6_SALDI